MMMMSQACENTLGDLECEYLSLIGECQTNDTVANLCRKFCSVHCPRECHDYNQSCPEWKREGRCQVTDDWIMAQCPLSCALCTDQGWIHYDPLPLSNVKLDWIFQFSRPTADHRIEEDTLVLKMSPMSTLIVHHGPTISIKSKIISPSCRTDRMKPQKISAGIKLTAWMMSVYTAIIMGNCIAVPPHLASVSHCKHEHT